MRKCIFLGENTTSEEINRVAGYRCTVGRRFVSDPISFSVDFSHVQRGGLYAYATRFCCGKLYKCYVAKASQVDQACLIKAASRLVEKIRLDGIAGSLIRIGISQWRI